MDIQLQKLILIFMRISSFIFMNPGFSFKSIPNTFKVGLATSISIIVYLNTPSIEPTNNLYLLGFLVMKEVLYGLALGYIVQLVFGFIEIAGDLIDFQAGFSMGQVYDPTMEKMASYFGQIYYWLGITVFFILDLHHNIINSIIRSFDYVPVTELVISSVNLRGIIELFSMTFEIAFNFAAPIIIVALITDIILGIISRTIPQINVLMLSMPLKALITYGVSFLILSWVINYIGENLKYISKIVERFFYIFS